jgi:hypothetical protein
MFPIAQSGFCTLIVHVNDLTNSLPSGCTNDKRHVAFNTATDSYRNQIDVFERDFARHHDLTTTKSKLLRE